MLEFNEKCDKLKEKLEPLLFKISEELGNEADFYDPEYYYNHQIEYHNHKTRLNNYGERLEKMLNKHLKLSKRKSFMSRFLGHKSVSVEVESYGVSMYIPLGDKGTDYYALYLVLIEVLDNIDLLDKGTNFIHKIYTIRPYYGDECD